MIHVLLDNISAFTVAGYLVDIGHSRWYIPIGPAIADKSEGDFNRNPWVLMEIPGFCFFDFFNF